jgi:curved DNA-binding protein
MISTHITEHPYYSRDKADVVLELPINVANAALGTSVIVPTPDGKKVRVRVPAGTQDGAILTIKGKGAPDIKAKGSYGNLKIKVKIDVPSEMNEEQKAAMEAFLEASPEEVYPW